jgi:hypothetical protein
MWRGISPFLAIENLWPIFLSSAYDAGKSESCHGCRLGDARRRVACAVGLAAVLFWASWLKLKT